MSNLSSISNTTCQNENGVLNRNMSSYILPSNRERFVPDFSRGNAPPFGEDIAKSSGNRRSLKRSASPDDENLPKVLIRKFDLPVKKNSLNEEKSTPSQKNEEKSISPPQKTTDSTQSSDPQTTNNQNSNINTPSVPKVFKLISVNPPTQSTTTSAVSLQGNGISHAINMPGLKWVSNPPVIKLQRQKIVLDDKKVQSLNGNSDTSHVSVAQSAEFKTIPQISATNTSMINSSIVPSNFAASQSVKLCSSTNSVSSLNISDLKINNSSPTVFETGIPRKITRRKDVCVKDKLSQTNCFSLIQEGKLIEVINSDNSDFKFTEVGQTSNTTPTESVSVSNVTADVGAKEHTQQPVLSNNEPKSSILTHNIVPNKYSAITKRQEFKKLPDLNLLLDMFREYSECTSYDRDGNYPIHHAVRNNNIELLRKHCIFLKMKNMCVDVVNNIGHTPLHVATQFDHVDCLKILLKNGASLDKKDKDGFIAYDIAVISKSMECLKVINESNSDNVEML